jgi:hypothetical protein
MIPLPPPPVQLARGQPDDAHTARAHADLLHDELKPIIKALSNPSPQPFRLATAALTPAVSITLTAYLTGVLHDDTAPTVLMAHRSLVAWHHVALHPGLYALLWDYTGERLYQLAAALADVLGTHAPPASLLVPLAVARPTLGMGPRLIRVNLFLRRAQLTAPDARQLHQAIISPCTGSLSEDQLTAFFAPSQIQPTHEWLLPPLHPDDLEIRVTLAGDLLYSLCSPQSLLPLLLDQNKASRFLPPQIHWRQASIAAPAKQREASPPAWFRDRLSPPPPRTLSTSLKPIPVFHATRVIAKAKTWRQRFNRHLGQAARIILDGRLCLPLDKHEELPLDSPNLPACFDPPAHAEFVDQIVAEYLITGVISWYPATAKPMVICPLSVVPKATSPFMRLVIDARGSNRRVSRWPSNMKSLAASAHIFQPGSVCWTLDIGKAYLCSTFMGCKHQFTKRVRADGFTYRHVGCSPDDCTLNCSKCMLGFRWREQYFAFNCPMFGGKVSGNILDALLAPVDRWVRAKGIPMLRWVDDYILALPPLPEHRHDTRGCGGIPACWICQQTYQRALVLQSEFLQLLADLGFTFNDKQTPPAQRGEFIGLGWDTLACTFWMPKAKAHKLAENITTILSSDCTTARALAQVRGKLNWFSPCLFAVRLLTRGISALIGGSTDHAYWDRRIEITAAAREELLHWQQTLPSMADHHRPFWRLSSAQLLDAANRRDHTVLQAILETDASFQGWGATLWHYTDDRWQKTSTSVPWSLNDPLYQVQCEAEALPQALTTFLPILAGRSVLHVTDCSPTVALPERGSAHSLQLQRSAVSAWRIAAAARVHLTSAWTPGDALVESGTDHLSRDALLDAHGAILSPQAWRTVQALAARHDIRLSVDLFAAPTNNLLPTFWARNPCPNAQGADAFSAASWSSHRCPRCDRPLLSEPYLFPPIPLLDKATAKALQDGVRGVLVCPQHVSKTWWPVVTSAALEAPACLPGPAVFSTAPGCDSRYASYSWVAIAFDFSRGPLPPRSCSCPHGEHLARAPTLRDNTLEFAQLHSRLARHLLLQDEDAPAPSHC